MLVIALVPIERYPVSTRALRARAACGLPSKGALPSPRLADMDELAHPDRVCGVTQSGQNVTLEYRDMFMRKLDNVQVKHVVEGCGSSLATPRPSYSHIVSPTRLS